VSDLEACEVGRELNVDVVVVLVADTEVKVTDDVVQGVATIRRGEGSSLCTGAAGTEANLN